MMEGDPIEGLASVASEPDAADGAGGSGGASYANVRGLSRGLVVLRTLNRMESGRATTLQLANETGLHRTTVRRLLETLIADGYVWRSESDDSYRLTIRVRELSEGFTDDQWISRIAAPLMGQLLQTVVWPSDLTTPSGDAMIIRETTHRFSPLSFHRAMVGRRMPMLLSASGRAYLANCSEAERESILNMLRSGTGGQEQQALANNASYVRAITERVRAEGFGWNRGDWTEQRKIGALAVPIRREGHAVACLNVVYLERAVSQDEAIRRFGAPLQDAASKIEAMLAADA